MTSSTLPTGCFVAGTLVHTPTGPTPIEALRVGDLVLSRDERTGEHHPRRITSTSTCERPVVRVIFESDHDTLAEYSLFASPDQPFWVEGTGWTPANRLRPAVELRLADATLGTVVWLRPVFRTDRPQVGVVFVDEGEEGVAREIDFADGRNYLDYVDIDESLFDGTVEDPYFRTTVHNLEIEDFHSYFAGKVGVCVRGSACRQDDGSAPRNP